jgi:hypothetical protein
MGQQKKATQPGKNAAAKKGGISMDISEDRNKPLSLLLLLVPYSADADEDCFKNDDTPYHDVYVSLLGRPKRHKGKSFSDRKAGDA